MDFRQSVQNQIGDSKKGEKCDQKGGTHADVQNIALPKRLKMRTKN